MSLLVVGTVAFDAIETPFGKTDKILGGAATYICLSASQGLCLFVFGSLPLTWCRCRGTRLIDRILR